MRLQYPFDLPTLPYKFDSLEPYMSEWTMKTHYEVNHQGYVNKTNGLIKDQPKFQNMKLAMLLTLAKGNLFDQAAQHFNHVVWWFSMRPPQSNNIPQSQLMTMIVRDFGSFENWKNDFIKKAKSRFGSGWCWLCFDNGKLENITTSNAGIPNFIGGKKILLVCDLWEHAYFCDYTTDREEYIRGWFECINWQMAEVRLLGEDMIFNLY